MVRDKGFVNKGTHSGCHTTVLGGQVGKQESCRVGMSLSVSTVEASLPISWRLYLPEVWTQDKKRRKATGIPEEIRSQTKPEIALQQIRTAVDRKIAAAPVLADTANGNDTKFRAGITELGLLYVVVVGEHVATHPWCDNRAPCLMVPTFTDASFDGATFTDPLEVAPASVTKQQDCRSGGPPDKPGRSDLQTGPSCKFREQGASRCALSSA